MLRFTFSLLLMLAPSLVQSQDVSKTPVTWAHEKSDLPVDAAMHFGKLDNGLRYVILPNSEPPNRVSLQLHIAAGSLMEAEDQQGLAHFLEHMAFNGTKNFPANQMVEFFQRLGMAFGADTNAHTSFDETVYKLELPDHTPALMEKGMLFLRDVADGMIIGANEIEKERGVILSEKNARDSVQFRMMIEGFKFTLPESLIPNRLPIGTEHVIKTAPQSRFLDFYRQWYTPERMTVVVVGDTTADEAKKYIISKFTGLPQPTTKLPTPSLGKVTTGQGLQAKWLTEKEAGQLTLSIDASRPSKKLPDSKATRQLAIVRSLADAMLNRRFEILGRREDTPFLSAAVSNQDWMHFVQSASMEIACKPEKWPAALSASEQELRRALTHGFSSTELTEAKANLLTELSNLAAQAPGRTSTQLAAAISTSVSDAKVFVHPTELYKWAKTILPTVTTAQCLDAIKNDWNTEDLRIFASGNLELPDAEAQLKQTWTASRTAKVEAQLRESEGTFGYTSFGTAGSIAAQKEIADLSITQVEFANGVRLNIKPTDFRKDVIELAASVGEGRMTLPKDKPGLMLFSRMMFDSAALGKHSVDDLTRLLAGRTVSLSLHVGEEAFTLSGTTNRADLLLQFQILAAQLMDTGWRSDGLAQMRQNLPTIYQQMQHTPEGLSKTAVSAFVAGDDYRFTFPQQPELAARTMQEMKDWLEPQFKNGAIEIGIVGDLDIKAVIEAAAATVGALPTRSKTTPTHDALRQVKFPTGLAEKDFAFESKIPKSQVLVYWPTTDRIKNVRHSRQLALLAEILSDRLRLKIREELGESYSPDALSQCSDVWPGYGQLIAAIVGQNKDVKQLGTIARELAAKLAAEGLSADELERARKPMLTQLEQQRRNNAYWLSTVVTPSQSKPERLDWARTMTDDFQAITLAELNALAKQYLPAERALIVRVVAAPPEAKPAK